MQAQWKSLTDNMAKLGAAGAAVFATMTYAIGKATQAFATQEAATKKLEIAVTRFAGADQRLLKQLKQTANELQDLTGIGNETIEAIAGMGLSMGIAGNQIDKATKAMDWLRRIGTAKPTPVIIITGGDPAKFKARALAAGAAGFYQKSEDPETLVAQIRQLLGGAAPAP